MPERKRRNAFENHIESDAFDVSQLEDLPNRSEIEQEILDFLDELPQPLNYQLWDSALDDRQKLLCAHLTLELVGRVVRRNHAEELEGISDDQLVSLLTVPLIIGMLAEERLHEKDAPAPPPPEVAPAPQEAHPLADFDGWERHTPRWGEAVSRIVDSFRTIINRFRRRY